jgi:hypothetical protein
MSRTVYVALSLVVSIHALLLLLSALVDVVDALAVCSDQNLVFFHIPKTAGWSIQSLLRKNGCKPFNGVTAANAVTPKYDAAHVTPPEFESYVLWKIGNFKDWRYAVSPSQMLQEWHTFAVVRNPYLRVLGAFEQRKRYDSAWGKRPNDFVKFMKWMDKNLADATFSWCYSPTITHFRPSHLFTHWPNGSQIMTTVLKQEQLNTELEPFLRGVFLANINGTNRRHYDTTLAHNNGTKNSGSNDRQVLCSHPKGCLDDDWAILLNKTFHTNETIGIVN